MATARITVNGTNNAGAWFNEILDQVDLHLSIDEGTDTPNDSDYVGTDTPGSALKLNIAGMPTDLVTMTGVDVVIRKYANGIACGTVQIFESDGTTALTDSVAMSNPGSPTNETVTLTVTGATDKAAWDDAILVVTSGAGSGDTAVFTVDLDITYSNAITIVLPVTQLVIYDKTNV